MINVMLVLEGLGPGLGILRVKWRFATQVWPIACNTMCVALLSQLYIILF